MAKKLSWTTIALQDLEEIWNRICDLGDEREAAEQLEVIYQNVESLTDFPRRFPVYDQYQNTNIREFKFKVYHVVYRIEEDSVLILAVFHTQRDIRSLLKTRRRQLDSNT